MRGSNIRRAVPAVALVVLVSQLAVKPALADLGLGKAIPLSLAGDGTTGGGPSQFPSPSADGSVVAFLSLAGDLVSGDTNGAHDVFARSADATITRASVSSDETQANAGSNAPVLSGNGRYVTYESTATNLVTGDTNAQSDVFVRDLQTGTTERVSLTNDGVDPQFFFASKPSISSDGRYVAFTGTSSMLVSDGGPPIVALYVRDRQTGTTTIASRDHLGEPVQSGGGMISSDGQDVIFHSPSATVVPGDTNGVIDLFVRDLTSGAVDRVSVDHNDGQLSGECCVDFDISGDGAVVSFSTATPNVVSGDTDADVDTFVRDRLAETTIRVNDAALGGAGDVSLSSDGAWAAFYSEGLASAPSQGGLVIVELASLERRTALSNRQTVPCYPNWCAASQPALTADGSTLFFTDLGKIASNDDNGANDIYRLDLGHRFTVAGGATVTTDTDADGAEVSSPVEVAVTSPGPGEVVVRAQPLTTTEPAEIVFVEPQVEIEAPAATAANPMTIDFVLDGSLIPVDAAPRVYFESTAVPDCTIDGSATPDPCIGGRTSGGSSDSIVTVRSSTGGTWNIGHPEVGASGGKTRLVVPFSARSFISEDGRSAAFHSSRTDVVPGDANGTDTDVFVRDLSLGNNQLVSVSSSEVQGNNSSRIADISSDGRFVAFTSNATNLVAGDDNHEADLFVRDRQAGTTELISIATDGGVGNHETGSRARFSPDGSKIYFSSFAGNLVANDTNSRIDVFERDLGVGQTELLSFDANDQPATEHVTFEDVSDDGRYILMSTTDWYYGGATGSPGDGEDNTRDLFLRDRQNGTTIPVTQEDGSDVEGGSMSGNGRFVVYTRPSGGSQIQLWDRTDTSETAIGLDSHERLARSSANPLISGDGGTVVFSADFSASGTHTLIYARNLSAGTTDVVGIHPEGHALHGYPSDISRGGRFVAVQADVATILRDRAVHQSVGSEVGAGGTLSTGSGNGEPLDPIVVSVTTPIGGPVSITEAAAAGAPAGIQVLGEAIEITAPDASISDPLTIELILDASLLPPDPSTVDVFRDGIAIADCTDGSGDAVPDPCVSQRTTLLDGDLKIVVLSSHASLWYAAVSDTQAPSAAMVEGVLGFTTVTKFPITWSGFDAGSGVASFDVQRASVATNGAIGSWTAWQTDVTSTSALFQGVAGRSYCFRVRAHDGAGNASAFSSRICRGVPFDDRALTRKGAWTVGKDTGAYLGTFVSTKQRGATLKSTTVKARQISVVAATCGTCGSVDVLWQGSLLKRISLKSGTTLTKRVVITVKRWPSVRKGTVTLRSATSAKLVRIEGLGITPL